MLQKKAVGELKTHVTYLLIFVSENRAVCEKMWKNTVKLDRPHDNMRMRFARWITKATETHAEYVILIAFHCSNGWKNAPHCYVIRTLPFWSSRDLGSRANFRNVVVVASWCKAQSDQCVISPSEALKIETLDVVLTSEASPYILIYPFPPELFYSCIAEHQKCSCQNVVKMHFRNYVI